MFLILPAVDVDEDGEVTEHFDVCVNTDHIVFAGRYPENSLITLVTVSTGSTYSIELHYKEVFALLQPRLPS